ncbi:glutathione S-transferase family protein [Rhizorhapis suberifaciens]|uniref:GST-like protein n=1 Tax=Rhizorhapis suberifaciens TaxID=13656 RepID=A0A840HS31_9SPHN|nr:glutathione S-transferase family protein [Rhizorhapis suberifaciens]MBB4640388.1 GST-like protein [Rhizorhapis suberifaciens]
MITMFGTASPNVFKILLMLEESGTEYYVKHVAVMRGEGQDPAFLAMNPFGKVPVIVDRNQEGEQVVFESGAILIYLADTYAPALLPACGAARWATLEWLVAQVAYAGPMLGQVNHYQLIPSEADSYAAARYKDQAAKIYRTFDDRLAAVPWLAGQSYSVADIAMYPWSAYLSRHGFDEADFPNLVAWRARIDARPAWRRAQAGIASLVRAGAATGAGITESDIDRFLGRTKPGPAADLVGYAARGSYIRRSD